MTVPRRCLRCPTRGRTSILLDTMATGDDELAVDHVREQAPGREGRRATAVTSRMPAQQFVRGEPDLYLRKGDEPEHLIDALRDLRH